VYAEHAAGAQPWALGLGLGTRPAVLILRLRHVPSMDATGLHALEELAAQCWRQGTALVLSGVRRQPAEVLRRSGLAAGLGAGRLCRCFEEALGRARELLAAPAPAHPAAPGSSHWAAPRPQQIVVRDPG